MDNETAKKLLLDALTELQERRKLDDAVYFKCVTVSADGHHEYLCPNCTAIVYKGNRCSNCGKRMANGGNYA